MNTPDISTEQLYSFIDELETIFVLGHQLQERLAKVEGLDFLAKQIDEILVHEKEILDQYASYTQPK